VNAAGGNTFGSPSIIPSFSVRNVPRTYESYPAALASSQGLTVLHFSAQFKRFLWDRVCS
jgi:hypothetical protein